MDSKKIKILAIDDNKDNLISLKALIKEVFPDVKILIALSGEKGLELAADEDPDVILLDIVMPGMDGFDVCRKLKANKELSDIPVVFVTALKGDKECRIRALECGAEAFLSKPIDECELIAQLRAMVKIKTANIEKRDEKERLAALVEEQTHELKVTHRATLNLLKELRRENDARKKSEKTLRESEERYRRLVEGSPDAIAVHSEGKFVFVNPAGAKLIGAQSPQELIGRSILDIVHPDSLSKVIDRIRHVTDGKEAPLFEEKFVKFDGSVIDVEVVGIPYSYRGQIATQVVVRDITERKLAEDELKEREARLQKIFEILPIGLWFADKNGKLIRGNPAGVKIWGAEPRVPLEELGLFKARRLPSGQEIAPEDWALVHTINNGVTVTDEMLEIDAFDGTKKIILNYTAPVLDEKGHLQGAIVVNYDITERKQAEEEIKNMKESLGKLNQRLDEIRENERALISREIHDQLGQSLTALKIDLYWLRGQIAGDSEEGAKLDGMIELVTDTIRDVQRISSELRPAILDDLGLAAALEWYCEEFANRTGLQVRMNMDDVQSENMMKNLAIYRVLQESLTNIIRHAGAKKVQIKLCKIKKDIVLIIQDDGIGISPDKIKSSKSLGLLGMFERVKQSGGNMEITTPDKGGTNVRIYVPIK